MLDRQLVLARIAYLQAELAALAALVRLDEVSSGAAVAAPALAAPAPAPVAVAAPEPAAPTRPAKRAKAPARWSYVPTAAYRLTGANPFRDGNNFALFRHLQDKYGDAPFTRVQLGDEIRAMQQAGTFKSSQPEQQLVIGFVSFAGEKGRLDMSSAGEGAPAAAPAPVEAPEPVEAAPAPRGPGRPKKTDTKPVTRRRKAQS